MTIHSGKFFYRKGAPLDGDMVCINCGSIDIQYLYKEWRTVSDEKFAGECEYSTEYWCPKCENNCFDIMTYKEWRENEIHDG